MRISGIPLDVVCACRLEMQCQRRSIHISTNFRLPQSIRGVDGNLIIFFRIVRMLNILNSYWHYTIIITAFEHMRNVYFDSITPNYQTSDHIVSNPTVRVGMHSLTPPAARNMLRPHYSRGLSYTGTPSHSPLFHIHIQPFSSPEHWAGLFSFDHRSTSIARVSAGLHTNHTNTHKHTHAQLRNTIPKMEWPA